MYDVIKAKLGFGLYRYAHTEFEREFAGLIDEPFEEDLIGRLTSGQRRMGLLEARQLQDLAVFAELRPPQRAGEVFSPYAADEIAVAMRWSRNLAHARLHLAVTVTGRVPQVLTALQRGEIDLRAAQALVELTDPLDEDTARAVVAAVLPKAGRWNVAELRRATRRAVARLDPAGAQQRHEARKQDRRIELHALDDGMAELHAFLPAPDATRIYRKVDAFARATAPDDPRTMDQRRADAFTDLLLQPSNTTHGGAAGTSGAGGGTGDGKDAGAGARAGAGAGGAGGKPGGVVVHVTMPVTMLMGLDEQPGELAGYGPIPADLARTLAADGTWRRLLTDPISGQLLDFGRTTYRPPAALADFVRARDHRCLFPGCSRPADACDIDHRTPHPEGLTNKENLGCLCRHHHKLKHEAGWTLEYRNGTYIWTTPTGHQYTREPEPIAQPATPQPPKPEPERANPNDEPPPF